MIGHRSRFRENDDFPRRRGPVVKKKPHFLMRAHVKLSAVGMCNAILGNDLNLIIKLLIVKHSIVRIVQGEPFLKRLVAFAILSHF